MYNHTSATSRSTIARLAYMYSVYQLIIVAGIVAFPSLFARVEWFVDCVRATCVIILIGWVALYMYIGHRPIYNMYTSLFPIVATLAPSRTITYTIILILDFCTHVAPLLVLGMPRSPAKSYGVAAIFLLIWYSTFRKRLPSVYGLLSEKEMDAVFYLLLPIITLLSISLSLSLSR